MPTFVYESAAATNGGTFLLPIPSITWFADSVMTALAEMTIPDNWRGDDETWRTYAVNQASEMLARYQLLNFNPFPVGMIVPFGGTIAPAGYLMCDGSDYDPLDYPELFAQIAYYFGNVGGNFAVPSLIDRNVVGSGGLYSVGDVGGEETVTLTTAEMPSHSHADIGHTHTIATVIGLPAQAGVGFTANQTIPLVPSNTGVGFANLANEGGSGAHNNMPPYQAALWIIYAGRE